MNRADLALVKLGRLLLDRGYRFTTITPESHRRVMARKKRGDALRDIFGWSHTVARETLPEDYRHLLEEAGCLIEDHSGLRSTVRFSTANDQIFVHSAFPTTDGDAVFFGPDTYRYLSLLRELAPRARRAVDVGSGSGAGGIAIASSCQSMILADINERALRYAHVNAAINRTSNVEIRRSDVLSAIDDPIDLVISNPPYLIDDEARLYRDGHGTFGEGLSVEITRQALDRLSPGGRLILYTATAVVDGTDTFWNAVQPLLEHGVRYSYAERDPDVFGEELDRPAYATVDRIAVVALDAVKL